MSPNLIDFSKPRYDQSAYLGRLRHFMNLVDPTTLLTTSKQIEENRRLLREYKEGKIEIGKDVTEDQLWLAQKQISSMIHPDTNEVIPMPFRMAGFVVFGVPVIAGMLLPNPSLASSLFWQWLNQTQNAGVNYFNRNATGSSTMKDYVTGYVFAVSGAMGVAGGLRFLTNRYTNFAPTSLVNKLIPFPAVAFANICNIFFMRRTELTSGIMIQDETGKDLGYSQIAAQKAITSTALTRILLPIPLLILPPVFEEFVTKSTTIFQKNPKLLFPFRIATVTVAFSLALPSVIAMFPQTSKVSTDELEPRFKNFKTQDGSPIKFAYFNKGL